jgi:hypothetical protein
VKKLKNTLDNADELRHGTLRVAPLRSRPKMHSMDAVEAVADYG